MKTAELVLNAASDFPTYSLVAASSAAERVLGAMTLMSLDIQVGRANDVVIFDVNAASWTVLAREAAYLRRLGDTGRSSQWRYTPLRRSSFRCLQEHELGHCGPLSL